MVKVESILKRYKDAGAREWVPGTVADPIAPDGKAYRIIHSVTVDDEGNEFTICAKDIILKPFVLSLDHVGDDHNLHQNLPEMGEDKRLSNLIDN